MADQAADCCGSDPRGHERTDGYELSRGYSSSGVPGGYAMMTEIMDGVEAIHADDDDLRFADPYADPEEPEYFRERRNYIQTDDQENSHAD